MPCLYERIEITGLSRIGYNPNGVYSKKPSIFGVPNVYEKDDGGGNAYRLWGPIPFAGNTYLLQYYTNNTATAQFASSPQNQSDICPNLIGVWSNTIPGFYNGQPDPGTNGILNFKLGCNINQIIVSNAGFADVNGAYTKSGVDSFGFARYFKNGGTQYNVIEQAEGGVYGWSIKAQPAPGIPVTALIYITQDFGSYQNRPDCPSDPSINWTSLNSSNNPPPTVSSGPPVPPHPLSPCGFDRILVSGAANNYSDYNGTYTWDPVFANGAFRRDGESYGPSIIYNYETSKWQIYRNLPNFISVESVNCATEVINWTNPYGAPGTPPTSIVPYIEPSGPPSALVSENFDYYGTRILTNARASGVSAKNIT